MFAAVASIMSSGLSQFATRQALTELGPYVSRGKGGKSPTKPTGIAAARRAATKARNRARHRRACRG